MLPSVARFPSRVEISERSIDIIHCKSKTDGQLLLVWSMCSIIFILSAAFDKDSDIQLKIAFYILCVVSLVFTFNYLINYFRFDKINISTSGECSLITKRPFSKQIELKGKIQSILVKKQLTRHYENKHVFAELTDGRHVFLYTDNPSIAALNNSLDKTIEVKRFISRLKVNKDSAYFSP